MAEYYTSTRDRRLAAALGTLGVRIHIRTTLLEKQGLRVTRFLLELKSACGKYHSKVLQTAWKNGTLQAEHPGHPFLTVMRGLHNRERLLDLAKAGKTCTLVRVPGSGDHIYTPGPIGLPGVPPGGGHIIETGDLKMAAALGTAGLPVLRITGSDGNYLFHIRASAIIDGRPIDGISYLQSWRRDKTSIPWGTPFSLAAYGLHNRERILDAERKEIPLVLIQKPHSIRSALIRADATDAAYDKAAEFFDQ